MVIGWSNVELALGFEKDECSDGVINTIPVDNRSEEADLNSNSNEVVMFVKPFFLVTPIFLPVTIIYFPMKAICLHVTGICNLMKESPPCNINLSSSKNFILIF